MSFNDQQTIAYVSLGSNLGDRAANLLMAVRGMLEVGLRVTRLSRIYETEPVETFAQPQFLNMVVELGSVLPPAEELLERLLRIEQSLGRTRDLAKGPRTIDLDILLYGNMICDTQLLTLPHPRIQQRRFVLAPLAELAPSLEHPILKRTIDELLQETTDNSEVKIWLSDDDQLKPSPEAGT